MTDHHHNWPLEAYNPGRIDRDGAGAADCGEQSAQGVIDQLARPVQAPDLTDRIMHRLGYQRLSPADAKRRVRHRRAQRLAIATAALGMLIAGAYLYELGPTARQINGPSVPAAIGHDVELHHNQMLDMIRTLQSVSPEPPAGESRNAQDASPADQPQQNDAPDEIDDAVDRSAVGDVMWV